MTFIKYVVNAAKGDLPEGFSIYIDEKPEIAHEKWEQYEEKLDQDKLKLRFDVVVDNDETGEMVGQARFLPTPDGKGVFSGYTEVEHQYRKLGIANAMYVYVEKVMKLKIFPAPNQDPDGKAFWNQKDRPFGKG